MFETFKHYGLHLFYQSAEMKIINCLKLRLNLLQSRFQSKAITSHNKNILTIFYYLQESIPPPPSTPPLHTRKITVPIQEIEKPKQIDIETLPQIELNLPKRPIRERLGAREVPKTDTKDKNKAKSPERLLITII